MPINPRKYFMMKKILFTLVLFSFLTLPANADEARFRAIMLKAESGDAKAQNKLGTYYQLGLSTEQNDVEAVKWFRKAAGQGYNKAKFNLGEMYEKGRGVGQDTEQALSWYKKACDGGCDCGCKSWKKLKQKAERNIVE